MLMKNSERVRTVWWGEQCCCPPLPSAGLAGLWGLPAATRTSSLPRLYSTSPVPFCVHEVNKEIFHFGICQGWDIGMLSVSQYLQMLCVD